MKNDNAFWENKIAHALGTEVGTLAQRKKFAASVMGHLNQAVVYGARATSKHGWDDLVKSSNSAIKSIKQVYRSAGRVGPQGMKLLTRLQLRTMSDEALLLNALSELNLSARAFQKVSRSRSRFFAAECIVDMICEQYHWHFDKPGKSNEETPFSRVCEVVNALFAEQGRNIKLGRKIRSKVLTAFRNDPEGPRPASIPTSHRRF